MNIEDYTPNNICKALGIQGFTQDTVFDNSEQAFRLLLCPSFDPEICITFWRSENHHVLEVHSCLEKLWGQSSLIIPGKFIFEGKLILDREFEAIFQLTQNSVETISRTDLLKNQVMCDGMGFDCFVKNGGESWSVSGNAYSELPELSFVNKVLEFCWAKMDGSRIKNAVADAARYKEIDFPKQEVLDPPDKTNLYVLGNQDEREEFLKMLWKADGTLG